MTISITITSDNAEHARDEMRRLLGDVYEYGPKQHDLPLAEPKGGAKSDSRNPENTGGEADPIQSLLDGTIKAIKAEMPNLAPSELERLAELEEAGKDRATLLKAIQDEIDSRSGQTGGDEGGAETAKPSEAKANTGLDDEEEAPTGDDTGLTGEAEPEAKADEPSLEDCREIGRQVQRLDNGTEMLRELLADIGAVNLSDAHAKGKGQAFVAGCEKILAEKGE